MGCESTVLSESDLGCVTICGCGTVSIHCGNAGMRISKAHFLLFARMIDDAFARLAGDEIDTSENPGTMSKLYPGMGPICG